MSHSRIVGGSTAKRVMACPGSVALCQAMPERRSSSYADEGTLLHEAIAWALETDAPSEDAIGRTYADVTLTQELHDTKLAVALAALDEIDPDGVMDFAVESVVEFGDLLPGVFGSADLLGRIGDKAVVLDWKFGDGVAVDVEENAQLLFYACAARRTPKTAWVFNGVMEVELIVVQPPSVKRWTTTVDRLKAFEKDLVAAVRRAQKPDAALVAGDHCRWCSAKAVCPEMTGAADRALREQMDALPAGQIATYLSQADLLEGWIKDLRKLAHEMLEEGSAVPGWKLVNKRAMRKWTDEGAAAEWLAEQGVDPWEKSVLSPAKAEKHKLTLPADLVVAVSSGSTLAPEDDPRAPVVQIGQTLRKAMAKLQ